MLGRCAYRRHPSAFLAASAAVMPCSTDHLVPRAAAWRPRNVTVNFEEMSTLHRALSLSTATNGNNNNNNNNNDNFPGRQNYIGLINVLSCGITRAVRKSRIHDRCDYGDFRRVP